MDVKFRQLYEPPARQTWVAMGLVVLCGLAGYYNSFSGPFVFDDPPSIVRNPTIIDLWRLDRVLSPPPGGLTVSGRPVVNLTVAINYALDGYNVRGYHAMNLAIHVLAGLALFGVVRRSLLLPRMPQQLARVSTPLALAVTVLWLVHPLQTESVTYIIQRAESIVMLFYLLTLYCTIRLAMAPRANLWRYAAFAACLVGMASKEVMVSAPLFVLLYDRAFLAGSFKEAWRRRDRLYMPLAATWALLLYLMLSTGERGGTAGFGVDITPWEYARSQFGVILHYLGLTFWPDKLCLDYGWPVANTVGEILPPAVVILALLAAAVWALFRRPKWAVPGALFFLALAPTSTFVPVKDLAFEHRMYLPLAGLVTVLVVGGYVVLEGALRRWGAGPAAGVPVWTVGCVVVAVVTAFVWRTLARNQDYRSVLSIWQDTATKAPNNPRAQDSTGAALSQDAVKLMAAAAKLGRLAPTRQDREKAAERLKKAEEHLARAEVRHKEAKRLYHAAPRLDGDCVNPYSNLGSTYCRMGQRIAAERGAMGQECSREDHRRIIGFLEKAVREYEEGSGWAVKVRRRDLLLDCQKKLIVVRLLLGDQYVKMARLIWGGRMSLTGEDRRMVVECLRGSIAQFEGVLKRLKGSKQAADGLRTARDLLRRLERTGR